MFAENELETEKNVLKRKDPLPKRSDWYTTVIHDQRILILATFLTALAAVLLLSLSPSPSLATVDDLDTIRTLIWVKQQGL